MTSQTGVLLASLLALGAGVAAVVVVMAAGYGVGDHTKPYRAGAKALKGLPPPANGTPDALMAAATVAVRKLAASEGVKVPVIPLAKTVTPPPASGSGSGSTSF